MVLFAELKKSFFERYQNIILGALHRDRTKIVRGALDMGILLPDDSEDLISEYCELCYLFTEPFAKAEWVKNEFMDGNGNYSWRESDLPQRVLSSGRNIIKSFRLRTPPHELIFLDRKMGGTFSFLSVLGCKINTRNLIEPIAQEPPLLLKV